MTFPAGEVTTGLIDGKVVLWTGKMNRINQPEGTVVCLFQGNFTGRKFFPFDLRVATSLRISLLNQAAFHLKILSHAVSALQEQRGYGIQV